MFREVLPERRVATKICEGREPGARRTGARPRPRAGPRGPALVVCAAQVSGGYEIRTREGVNPTRFPSVRPRPLGESSVEKDTDRGYDRVPGCPPIAPGTLSSSPSCGV